MRKHRNALLIFLLIVAPVVSEVSLRAQAPTAADLNAVSQIKDEGFNHSQVMDTMSYLTDVYGPRLTNSPNVKQAAEWTMSKMKDWQLANVHQELWGPFGKGWSNERFCSIVGSSRGNLSSPRSNPKFLRARKRSFIAIRMPSWWKKQRSRSLLPKRPTSAAPGLSPSGN